MLKLKYNKLLSSFAFNFNIRRYSEESHESEAGKSKTVSFAPARPGKDGSSGFDKAWTLNTNASIKSEMGSQQFHTNADGSRGAPIFDFTLVESPERNFKKAEEVSNADILTSFGPVDRAPFSREGVGIISLPFLHVRQASEILNADIILGACTTHCILLTKTFVDSVSIY